MAADAMVKRRDATPQKVFDSVAPYYDLLNSCLSLGLDRVWRRRVARSLELAPGAEVLDVATGTGALARAIWRAGRGQVRVFGVDLNDQMLKTARHKSRNCEGIEYARCPAEALPYPDNQFDAVTMAMAIDDLDDRHRGASEMMRVLKPGGQLAILELSLPQNWFMQGCYRVYLSLFPLFDRIVGRQSYSHLRDEIRNYKGREALQSLLEDVGSENYQRRELTGGVATIHMVRKPEAQTSDETVRLAG